MDDAIRAAEETWPNLSVSREAFREYLAERVPPGATNARVADLYLVFGCLSRCPRALRLFESRYLSKLDRVLSRIDNSGVTSDAKHLLVAELLMGDEGRSPKLARYSGRGDLEKWLRVTAIRRAQDLLRKCQPEQEDDGLFDLVSPMEDQELAYMKRVYRAEFKRAFEEALASLGSRERNVLRHQVLDGLTAEQIGSIYRVHRITVVRWNKQIREKLFNRVRASMMRQLEVGPHEVASIARLIQSQLDVSLRRCLG